MVSRSQTAGGNDMITVGQPRYRLEVRNLKGVGNLLVDVLVAGTGYNIVCTITIPRKFPSLLDADLLPELSDNPLLANLSEYEKKGLAIQIKTLRKTIVDYLNTVPF